MRKYNHKRLFIYLAILILPVLKGTEVVHGDEGSTIKGEVIILDSRGEKNEDRAHVVVFLDRVNNNDISRATPKPMYISQKDRRFTPRVLAVTKGTTVHFPNDDTIFHNVFSLSRSQPFDLGIYKQGNSKTVTFTKPGLVRVYCNLHPMMMANILILDNPYFTVTDKQGTFTIPNVPDGKYLLRIWHEFGDEIRKEISVSGTTSTDDLQFTIQETRTKVTHKNKIGKPYKAKY